VKDELYFQFYRLAMACLEMIRENFIEIDLDLINMEEAYNIFGKYKIDIPKEDTERVESLRFNFQNMVNHVSL
jgi:dynein heavy chain